MRKLIMMMILITTYTLSCVTPVVPVPPSGCTTSDAIIHCDSKCKCQWIFIGCIKGNNILHDLIREYEDNNKED